MKYAVIKTGIAIAAAALGACASVPKPLQGTFAETTPEHAERGQAVRWGGEIIAVEPLADRTCIQVMGKPLGASSRPIEADKTTQRFIACKSGFYDPVIFSEGREITVTGTIGGTESRKVGEYDYALPRVDAEAVFLWPQRYSFDRPYAEPVFLFAPGWYGFGSRVYYRHPVRRGAEGR